MTAHRSSLGLFTDLYELTMAQAYWQSSKVGTATFSLFMRKHPPDRGYLVFAGLPDVLDYLESLHFTGADIDYLRSLKHFDGDFLNYLQTLRFTGTVRAMQEGAIFFKNEPVVEVTAPMIEAQLVETYLLNQVNLQSLLATKASRVVHAAQGREIADFAARRAHGLDAANKLARVAYLVGFASTSNVMAGCLYGVPVSGTMAHAYVLAFESEIESFRHFAQSFPGASTFLVDTYDTLAGARKAAAVGREMAQQGHLLRAIRLDSGDLLDLSRKVRAILDKAGLAEVQILATGGLDEFAVATLVQAGAPIAGFGVGTKIGVSADAPWTDCVYKLVEYSGRPVVKLSTNKQTLPGAKQVFRCRDRAGTLVRDIIACAAERPDGREPLLQEVMTNGRRLRPDPPLKDLRDRFRREFACLPGRHKPLQSPEPYEVQVSPELEQLSESTARTVSARETGTPE